MGLGRFAREKARGGPCWQPCVRLHQRHCAARWSEEFRHISGVELGCGRPPGKGMRPVWCWSFLPRIRMTSNAWRLQPVLWIRNWRPEYSQRQEVWRL